MSRNGRQDQVALFIDPFSYHFLEDRLFDLRTGAFGGDNIQAPWVYLRDWFGERGVPVSTADRLTNGNRASAANVYVSLGMQDRCRDLAGRDDVTMSAFFAFEGPIVDPTLYRNLSWVKDCVKRVFSFSNGEALAPFLTEPMELHRFCVTYPFDSVDDDVWSRSERGFLVMINGNKRPRLYVNELYTERLRALEFFGRFDEIDLFGIGWDVPPFRMGQTWMPYTLQRAHRSLQALHDRVRPDPLLAAARARWLGSVDSKLETLGRYTFAICYENQILDGWITEKIFDCFRAGTVPVYWGPPDVEEYIPRDCYIDRTQFDSYEDLRSYLRSLSPAAIQQHREAAREFLGSPSFYPFSTQAFVDRLADIVEEDVGLRVR
jgi:alpha(1,3/1,4) fucosyltransferase